MTPDDLDSEPVVSTFARKRCSSCEGWSLTLTDGVCSPCLGQPALRLADQQTPKWLVYDGDSYHTLNADEAIKAAACFGTTARRIR